MRDVFLFSGFSMLASDILGHQRQIASLQADIDRDNVAHAYLFDGPSSLGKMTVAKWFARTLLTRHLSSEQVASAERQMEQLIHPDYLVCDQLWIKDVQEDWNVLARFSNIPQHHRSKASARTDSISIDDVRALSERLHDTGSSRYLVCVIRSLERMQAPAANSFLKMLEEPPRRVVFLLTTSASSQLLPTLLSRTRVLHFDRVGQRVLLPLLSHLSADDTALILGFAQGAVGTVMRFLKDPALLRAQKQHMSHARAFWQTLTRTQRMHMLMDVSKKENLVQVMVLALGLALRESSDLRRIPDFAASYAQLVSDLRTNAHRGLLFQRFVLSLPS